MSELDNKVTTPAQGVSEVQAIPKVENITAPPGEESPRKALNTSRAERLKTFKPKPALPPVDPLPPPSIEEIAPLNPDINPDDVRLTVSIRLETRDRIIHERAVGKDDCAQIIKGGLTLDTAPTILSSVMGNMSAVVRYDFEKYLKEIHPPSPKEVEKDFMRPDKQGKLVDISSTVTKPRIPNEG